MSIVICVYLINLGPITSYFYNNVRAITSVNEEWKKLRTAWNKVILNSTEVYSYLDELNDVQSDAIQLLNTRKGKDGRHPALDKFLFSWALESRSKSYSDAKHESNVEANEGHLPVCETRF